MSQQKRNPFKKSLKSSKEIKNALSHLTNKAIGFNDSQNCTLPNTDNDVLLPTVAINDNTIKHSENNIHTSGLEVI